MTAEREKEIKTALAAHGLAVMTIEDRDTLLATLEKLVWEKLELEKKLRVYELRADFAERTVVAARHLARTDENFTAFIRQIGEAL